MRISTEKCGRRNAWTYIVSLILARNDGAFTKCRHRLPRSADVDDNSTIRFRVYRCSGSGFTFTVNVLVKCEARRNRVRALVGAIRNKRANANVNRREFFEIFVTGARAFRSQRVLARRDPTAHPATCESNIDLPIEGGTVI